MRRGTVVAVAVTMFAGLVLVGCAGPAPEDARRGPESPGASAGPSTPLEPSPEPVLVPDGTARDNLALFTAITMDVWGGDERASGRAYVEALTRAGFDPARMQVTPDRTTVGNPVESLQFSVAWGESECLIGQVGPSTGDPVTAVVPQLATGACLIGGASAVEP